MGYVVVVGEEDRNRWIIERGGSLGASDTFSLMDDLKPEWWSTSRGQLIESKAWRGQLDERLDDPKLAMYWGSKLEDDIVDGYNDGHVEWHCEPLVPRLALPFKALVRNPAFPHLHATPDCAVGPRVLGEVKNPGPYTQKKWEREGVPVYYQVQAQQQIMVLEADAVYFMVLFGNRGPVHVWRVAPDRELQARIVRVAADAWAEVEEQRGRLGL